MNRMQVVGQILLWGGFLSAALASVSRKEFDFLPQEEKAALAAVNSQESVSRGELLGLAGKPVRDLETDELTELLYELVPMLDDRAAYKQRLEALSKPLQSLTVEELQQLKDLLPRLEQSASQEPDVPLGVRISESISEEEEANRRANERLLSKKDLINERILRIENRWPTVPWLWYGLSIAVGVAGVYCLRTTAKTAQQESSRVEHEFATLKVSLSALEAAIQQLSSDLETMKPEAVVAFIDDRFAEPFAEFADSRNALIQRFDLQVFADVMTEFSSAERFVNRAWSAAADGYVNEVKQCVERAKHHLEQASVSMSQAENAPAKTTDESSAPNTQ